MCLTQISSNIYASLPKSLTSCELRVRRRIESPLKMRCRREITMKKKVSELSTINSIREFPVPKTIESIFQKINLKANR